MKIHMQFSLTTLTTLQQPSFLSLYEGPNHFSIVHWPARSHSRLDHWSTANCSFFIHNSICTGDCFRLRFLPIPSATLPSFLPGNAVDSSALKVQVNDASHFAQELDDLVHHVHVYSFVWN